jgi:hypothetical protein
MLWCLLSAPEQANTEPYVREQKVSPRLLTPLTELEGDTHDHWPIETTKCATHASTLIPFLSAHPFDGMNCVAHLHSTHMLVLLQPKTGPLFRMIDAGLQQQQQHRAAGLLCSESAN